MNNDIIFCGHKECTSKECMRHNDRIPFDVPVSVAMFDCPYLPIEDTFGSELFERLRDDGA